MLDRIEVERRLGEGDEDEPGRDPNVQFLQPVFVAVEVLRHQPRGAQRAVIAVGPGVVRADEEACVALRLGADLGAAMPAHIEHRVDRAIGGTCQDDLLVAQPEQLEVACIGNDARMRQAMPVPAKQAFHVALEDRGIHVERPDQAMTRPVRCDQVADPVIGGGCLLKMQDAHRWLLIIGLGGLA